MGLPRCLSGKESACQCRRCRRCVFDPWVRKIPWSRKWQPIPLETSMNRGAWWVTVCGAAKSRTWLSYWAHSIYFIYDKYILKIYLCLQCRRPGFDPLEEDRVTHSSVLAWDISWTGEPGRLQFTGSQRVRHDWLTTAQHSTSIYLFFRPFIEAA